jgi:hypothetical protein
MFTYLIPVQILVAVEMERGRSGSIDSARTDIVSTACRAAGLFKGRLFSLCTGQPLPAPVPDPQLPETPATTEQLYSDPNVLIHDIVRTTHCTMDTSTGTTLSTAYNQSKTARRRTNTTTVTDIDTGTTTKTQTPTIGSFDTDTTITNCFLATRTDNNTNQHQNWPHHSTPQTCPALCAQHRTTF